MLMILLSTTGFIPSGQQDNLRDEATLKALFIYNFTKQIEWPSSNLSSQKFVIGIYGRTEVGDRLTQLLGSRKIFDKTLEVRQLKSGEEMEACQIVFIAKGNVAKIVDHFDKIQSKGVLTITEEKSIVNKGVCINILEKEEKMCFEISESAFKKSNLKISKQLIDLATSVKQ
jgi:hypothetical protein